MKKNIFLVQTDKPSRLYKFEDKLIKNDLIGLYDYKEKGYIAQHIYITDNSEIKKGDFCISNLNIIDEGKIHNSETIFNPKTEADLILLKSCKKIVLTDDEDLIKNNVQEISEDFLQWFVQNSDCESVEVNHFGNCCGNQLINQCINCKKYKPIYKIIIPQDETKQELPQLGTKEFNNLASAYFGGKPQEELKTSYQWQLTYPDQVVMDPDGWDRKNYQYSWFEEKITLAEYNKRMLMSTCVIFTPQEEIKPEPNFYEKLKEYFETTPREKVLEDWNKSAHLDNIGPTVEEFVENSNEERLMKIAHKILCDYGIKSIGEKIGILEVKKLMVKMANLQKEQDNKMYSEEDMIEFGKFCYNDAHSVYKITTFKELFEKFKNK